MGSINKSSCNYDPETPGLPRRYAAPASWQKVEPHEIAKFAKCRPGRYRHRADQATVPRRSQASRYCPEFGLPRARNEAPKRACRRRLTVLEAVPEPRPTPSRRAAPPTALCWALPSTAWNLCWLCCLYGSFELLSLGDSSLNEHDGTS